MAVENENMLLQRAQKVEDQMKSRPNYNYEHISKIIDAQRLEEKRKREMKEKEIRE